MSLIILNGAIEVFAFEYAREEGQIINLRKRDTQTMRLCELMQSVCDSIFFIIGLNAKRHTAFLDEFKNFILISLKI